MSRRKSIILPLDLDDDITVQAHPDDGDVRIRLPQGGFIRAGLFRFALDKGAPDEVIERGPVTVRVLGKQHLEVEIRLPKGETISHQFKSDVINDVLERIDQIKALLHSYCYDVDAMERADKKRRESRGHQAAA